MLFNKKTEIKIYVDKPLIIIRAICKNKELGKMSCMISEDLKVITILDIICKKNNRGYGSLMMNKLIDIVKQDEYTYIDDWLSVVNDDHIKRLYHFYQKFGFEVISNKDRMKIADIKLVL